jgi:hypothetical protein
VGDKKRELKMRGEPNGLAVRPGTGVVVLFGLALLLGGCGTSLLPGSSTNIFSSQKATSGPAPAGAASDTNLESADIECPSVGVRTGAATLTITGKPKEGEAGVLDLRYQGTIIRTARECHVNAGVMTMKVGIEGRIITGPAGGPGAVDVPLRIAVVHEGVNPKTIISKLAHVPVTVTSEVDRVTFAHVDPDIAFPMPQPAGLIDSYVVYVGFDPSPPPPEEKKPRGKRKPMTKPNPAAKPKQG